MSHAAAAAAGKLYRSAAVIYFSRTYAPPPPPTYRSNDKFISAIIATAREVDRPHTDRPCCRLLARRRAMQDSGFKAKFHYASWFGAGSMQV